MVGVHDPEQLDHLNGVLEHSNPGKQDVIVVAVKPGNPAHPQKQATDRVETVRDTGRKEDAEIEQIPAEKVASTTTETTPVRPANKPKV